MEMKLNDDEIKFDFSFFESGDSLLNMSLTHVKKESRKRAKSKMRVLLVLLVIIFLLAFFFGSKTKYFSLLLFANNNYKRCTLLNKLDLYQYNIRYLFLFFMYSYLNIYSTFCYLVLDVIVKIFNDILRFEIFDSRPFWDNNDNVFPCRCEFTPSQPSSTSCNSILFMSLIYFLKVEEKQRNKIKKAYTRVKSGKNYEEEDSSEKYSEDQTNQISNIALNIFLFFIIGLIIFVDTIPLLQNIEYLHQSIFGLCIGFAFYYWVFHIVRLNHLNRKQFLKIIKQPGIVLTSSIIIIIIILFISKNISKRILAYQIINIQKFCEIPKDLNSSKEMLNDCVLLFEILGAYFGLLLEYKIGFNSNDVKFTLYNVKSKNGESYFQEKSPIIKLIRFLLLFFIEVLFFRTIIEFWIKHNLGNLLRFLSLLVLFFFKGIFYFYFMKIIMKKLGLINDKIFDEEFEEDD